MLSVRELEAQAQANAKALAPVFVRLLEESEASLRKEFGIQLAERDKAIAELKQALANQSPLTVDDVLAAIDLQGVAKATASLIPAPKDGVDGLPGKDADPAFIRQLVAEEVTKIPVPANGKDGVDGRDGADGKSVDPETVKQMVQAAVAEIPVPKNGTDGKDGKNGVDGKDGVAPTVSEVAAVFERRFSDLALAWERQARDLFDKAVDKMPIPKDGKDGRDALPLESFDMVLAEDGRTVIFKMQSAECSKEHRIKFPTVIDRGRFNKELAYDAGDGVSYAGSFWIAKCDNPLGTPGSGETDWRCAVKRGEKGRDLRDNASKHDPSKGVSIKDKES